MRHIVSRVARDLLRFERKFPKSCVGQIRKHKVCASIHLPMFNPLLSQSQMLPRSRSTKCTRPAAKHSRICNSSLHLRLSRISHVAFFSQDPISDANTQLLAANLTTENQLFGSRIAGVILFAHCLDPAQVFSTPTCLVLSKVSPTRAQSKQHTP